MIYLQAIHLRNILQKTDHWTVVFQSNWQSVVFVPGHERCIFFILTGI